MCERSVRSCFATVIHLLSGDTATEPMRPMSFFVTTVVLPSSTVWLYSCLPPATYSNDFESGDQIGPLFSLSRSVTFFGARPSGSEIQISSRPDRSDTNAMYLPSADHFGNWLR